MTDYPKNIDSNGFLSPPIKTRATNTKLGRSGSVPTSERSARSSLSRVTHVEEDAQIAPYEDSSNITPSNYTCLDHILAIVRIVFCVPMPKKMENSSPGPVKGVSFDMESSPWVLPVHVVSTRRDTDKHPVIKRAKCTIDTGNMQGNIVSREFVEKVLQYSEANFVSLTAAEKEGGFGVTGHKLVPEGAIYLTWYYDKSTRVFHNMRFLVSPYSQCDLIIGARSIQKDNLLGVPNLMATTNSRVAHTTDQIDEEEERLQNIYLKLKCEFEEMELGLLGTTEDTNNTKKLKDCANARDIAHKYYLIRNAEVANNPKLVAQLKEDLEKLPGYETYLVPSKSDTTSSGTAQQNGSIPIQRTVKKAVEQSSPTK
ncbi:f89a6edd-eb62-44db-92fa-ca1b2a8d573b [Sclerotinia trifoliorum]|uniref:F89a6edd-eb62-44db-92fa-ca1b2a8d573b n=1 Tax=Sclerotinia trifoliorum TaxID=28548 RepID=A0A8H2VPW8_9HELO|nr:f89a6edd-eb62-44db-92fa-ca1b2a8d573b [Sclerotinia trifoliorum]